MSSSIRCRSGVITGWIKSLLWIRLQRSGILTEGCAAAQPWPAVSQRRSSKGRESNLVRPFKHGSVEPFPALKGLGKRDPLVSSIKRRRVVPEAGETDEWLRRVFTTPEREELTAAYDAWAVRYEADMLAVGYMHLFVAAGLVGRYVRDPRHPSWTPDGQWPARSGTRYYWLSATRRARHVRRHARTGKGTWRL